MSGHLMKTIALGMVMPEAVAVTHKRESDVAKSQRRKQQERDLLRLLEPRAAQTRNEGTGSTLLTGQTGVSGQPRVNLPTLLGG